MHMSSIKNQKNSTNPDKSLANRNAKGTLINLEKGNNGKSNRD